MAAMIACWRAAFSRAAAAAVGARVWTPMRMLARSGVSRASPDAEVTIWGIGVGGACAAASAMADAKRMTDAAIEIIELPIPTRMASTPKVDLKYLGARDFARGAMGEAARESVGAPVSPPLRGALSRERAIGAVQPSRLRR